MLNNKSKTTTKEKKKEKNEKEQKQHTKSVGSFPHPPGWNPHDAPSGSGAFSPGIFRFGYDGGAP